MAGITATAGCVGDYSILSDEEIILGNVRVSNITGETAEIIVNITDDTGTIFQDLISVDSLEAKVIDKEWSDAPSQYTISYAGGERINHVELPPEERSMDSNCIDIDISQDVHVIDIFFRDDNPPWGDC